MEKYTSLKKENAFSELRTLAIVKGCKILEENPPNRIKLLHGSYKFFPSKNIKKEITFEIFEEKNHTKIYGKYEIPNSVKIIDAIIFPFLIIISFFLYFFFISLLKSFKESLPQIPQQGAPFQTPFEIESFFIIFEISVSIFLVLAFIFIALFPTVIIKYKMGKKTVEELINLIRK